MTNQQGAPEALRLAAEVLDWMPTSDTQRSLWYRHQEALAVVKAALVEAQQPAPSAAAVDEGFLRSVIMLCNNQGASPESIENFDSGDKWIADLWRQAEQLIDPTPQADSQRVPIMPKGESAAPGLRAMATGYPAGHLWDRLDAKTCIRGALEIEALRAARAPADSVTAPASGVVVQPSCPGIPRPGCNYLAQCESVCNKCGRLHSTRFLEDSQPVAAARRWSTYEQAIADPIFQTARSIMGTENIGQDRQLVKAINHVIDSTPPAQAADSVMEDAARQLIEDLVRHIDRQTCTHEETYRGGVIWEICTGCGAKWADDRGGKPKFEWPDCVEKARAFLNAARKQGANHD